MRLIDHHSHLQHPRYKNKKDEVIEKSCKYMKYVVISGANEQWNIEAVDIAEKCDNFFATVGYHPLDAIKYTDDEWEEALSKLKKLAKHQKVIAIGEIGLDYHWIKDEKQRVLAEQRFIDQIHLANNLGKGIVVHSWDAEEQAIKIAAEHVKRTAVFHCYGTHKYHDMLENHGFYASACTNIVRNKSVKKFAKKINLDFFMTETDAPYLAPIQGDLNFPWNVEVILKEVSKMRNLSVETIANKIVENFERIYSRFL